MLARASWYVCVMNSSIDIVHVRWHTRQHSTIQNQDISLIRRLLRRLLVSFCLVPILGGARLVLLLKERAFRVGNHGNIC